MSMLDLVVRAPSELSNRQRQRLVESITQQLALDEGYRISTADFLADDFTLEDYEAWFREVVE